MTVTSQNFPLPAIPSDAERARVQKRTLVVVVVSQILGGAGLAAGVAVGALLAQELLGSEGLAGLPTALFTLGSAAAAFLVGRLTHRWGRRIGLGLGFTAGGCGAAGVVIAAITSNVPFLFVSLFVYGAGTATNLQARYAGTDLAPESRRGTAISVALVATTFGAVAGPNVIEPLGHLAEIFGVPVLAGPFMLAAVAYLAAGIVVIALLRPDPYLMAKSMSAADDESVTDDSATVPRPGTGAYVGATVMVLTQIAMVAIMTMTPVHMQSHHHDLSAVGLVISLHVAAMFLPSLLTGVLVDKIGRTRMAIASGCTLLAAGVVAAMAPGDSLGLLILALILLGLGWNFGFIAGTALVVDATVPQNRPRTQGTIDVLIALSGAGGGAMSGIMMSATSFEALSLAGGLIALLLIPMLLWARQAQFQSTAHSSPYERVEEGSPNHSGAGTH